MWSCHCMHNKVTYKRGRKIATQTSRSLDWQHKIRQRDGDIFWKLIVWFNVKIIIQKFGMTRGWSTFESCCEPLMNYSDTEFISLDMVYNESWVPIEMGSEIVIIWCILQPQKFDWLVYSLIQRRRSRIFDADVCKNVFEDDEGSSTARYTTSMNVDMMCRKIRENLVIGYTTRPATSSHLKINFGSLPPNFGFRCLRLLHAMLIGLEISRIVNWISIVFTSDGTFQRSMLFELLQ